MGFSALSSIYMPYLETGGSQKWSALEINFTVQRPQIVIYYQGLVTQTQRASSVLSRVTLYIITTHSDYIANHKL